MLNELFRMPQTAVETFVAETALSRDENDLHLFLVVSRNIIIFIFVFNNAVCYFVKWKKREQVTLIACNRR